MMMMKFEVSADTPRGLIVGGWGEAGVVTDINHLYSHVVEVIFTPNTTQLITAKKLLLWNICFTSPNSILLILCLSLK